METQPYFFLACLGCRFFMPKRANPLNRTSQSSIVGICAAENQAKWVTWNGLDQAVRGAGGCSKREPRPAGRPGCPLFETTTELSTLDYPESCIYCRASICPMECRRA